MSASSEEEESDYEGSEEEEEVDEDSGEGSEEEETHDDFGEDEEEELLDEDDRVDPETQAMVDQLLTKDSRSYYDLITTEDKLNIIQSWGIVIKRRKQIVEALTHNLLNDPTLEESGTTEFKGVSLEIVVDAYAFIISVIEGSDEEDSDDEDAYNGNANEIKLPDDEIVFSKLKEYLGKIVDVHIELEIEGGDILEVRRVLLSVLKKDLGGAWSAEMKDAWNKLTGFVTVALISRSSKDRVIIPTKNQVKLCLKTWKLISDNKELAEEVFFQTLFGKYPEMTELFENTSGDSIIAQFTKALALAGDLKVLVPMLHEVGTKHRTFGVKPAMFPKGKGAFMTMLEQCSGALWQPRTVEAWQVVWKFCIGIMSDSLQEAWLLHLPPEPCMLRCVVMINHIKEINPVNMNFYSDIQFDFWNGSIPSQKFAFDKGETDMAVIGGDKGLAWKITLNNTEEIEDVFKRDDMPLVAKLDDTTFYQRGHYQGYFSQYFDLRRYPFDSHSLRFYFQINTPIAQARFDQENENYLKVGMGESSKLFGVGGTDWDVYNPSLTVQRSKENRKKYQRLVVSVPIARRFGNFIHQVLLPLLLIDAVAFQVYWLEPRPVFYRMNTFVPLLLTLFAFKWTLAESVPPVPYMTKMDLNFNCSYLFFLVHTSVTLLTRLLQWLYGSYTWYLHLTLFFFVLITYTVTRAWVLHQCYLSIVEFTDNIDERLINSQEKLVTRNYSDAEESEVSVSQSGAGEEGSASATVDL